MCSGVISDNKGVENGTNLSEAAQRTGDRGG